MGRRWALRPCGSFLCLLSAAGALVSAGCSTDKDEVEHGSGSGGALMSGSGGFATASGGSSDGAGGQRASTLGCSVFSADSPWNTAVSDLPVHSRSAAYLNSIGTSKNLHPDFGTEWEGAPIGIPYIEVDIDTTLQLIQYSAYGAESDSGPFPIPLDAPIEGGPDSTGDRHVIAVDWKDCTIYELYRSFPRTGGWEAASGAEFDLAQDEDHPEGCTSADAAGLPIFPGLVRYDEVVEQGVIPHALRFTVSSSQRAYVYPARHYASSDSDPDLPPMGLRLRMRDDYGCEAYSTEVQVICTALKTYGMIVADNGSDWYISGAPDSRWDDDALGDLKDIPGSAFEVVETGEQVVTEAPDCQLGGD